MKINEAVINLEYVWVLSLIEMDSNNFALGFIKRSLNNTLLDKIYF